MAYWVKSLAAVHADWLAEASEVAGFKPGPGK